MATIGGPNTEKDNLVFGYDTGYGVADNSTSTRFYPGEPSVNLLPSGPATGTGVFSREAAHVESFTYTKVTNYKGRADVHRIYCNPTGTNQPYADYGGQYHKSGGSAVGDVYAVSLDFYVAKGNNPPSLSTVYANGYKSPTSAGAASIGGNSDTDLGDGWTRRTRIITITTAGNTWLRFGCNTSGNETEIYIDNVKVELKSHATPFVDGTRSSTQSLIDLKRTTDIDLSNVSFNSTGQPIFDGTDDSIDLNNSLNSIGGEATFEMVFKATETNDTYRIMLGWGYGNSNYSGIHIGSWTSGYTDESFHVTFDASDLTMIVRKGHTFYKDNQYHHAVVTTGVNSYSIWIDGVEQTFVFAQGSQSTVFNNIVGYNSNIVSHIGKRPYGGGSGYFKGEIPIMKVYGKVLSDDEIKQNFNAYKNRFDI